MTAPAATPEKASMLEDFVDILFSPAKVYARRATAGVGGPLVIVAVICAVLAFVNAGTMQGVMDAEFARATAKAMANNPSMTAEQMEGMRGFMEMSTKYGLIIIIPIMLLLLGTVTWLVGKILGSAMNWGTGLTIATFAFVPRIIEQMLVAIQGLLLDTSMYTSRFSFSWGVGRFMDPNGPQGMLALLGRIDVFTLWTTVLIAVGFMAAGKIDKNKAIIGGVIMWVLGALPSLPAILSGQ